MSEWTCPHCGFDVDTPNHNLGCKTDPAEPPEPGDFWKRRYDEQHRTLHDCEDKLKQAKQLLRRLLDPGWGFEDDDPYGDARRFLEGDDGDARMFLAAQKDPPA